MARATGCRSVAFTYNDPIIFAEYALDTADACHALGLQAVAVTNGYLHEPPRREFFAKMDAANVDLKAFTDDFYVRQTGAHLVPVLETLEYIRHATDCWLEITTLLIPGLNDSDAELDAMTQWLHTQLGDDTPLHFTAFHPAWKLTDRDRTPAATLTRAWRIALANGLKHVYTGNVHDREGGRTACAQCGTVLIERDWHTILGYTLDARGQCPACGTALAGRFGAATGHFGRQRIPVRIDI